MVMSSLFNFGLDVMAFFLGNMLFMIGLPLVIFRRSIDMFLRIVFGYTNTVNPVNRVVLVTGCDSGIGRATCIRLLQRGFTVMAGCLDAKAAASSSSTLAEFKPSANLHILQLNVARQNEIDGAVKYVNEWLDNNPNAQFWAVVNNAGIHAFAPFEFLSFDTLQQMFDVNVFGLVRVTKAFVPLMRRGGHRVGGRIVNVGNISGSELPIPMTAFNGATKAAVMALSHVMSTELKPRFGIESIAVNPDDCYATEMFNPDRLVGSFNREVERARPEVIDAYGGQERVERMRQLIGKSLPQMAQCNPKPVIDAIFDAVASTRPSMVYYPIDWKTRVLRSIYMASPMLFKRIFIDWAPVLVPSSVMPESSAMTMITGMTSMSPMPRMSMPMPSMPSMSMPSMSG